MRRPKKSRRNAQPLDPVDVDALKAGLPHFWPVRQGIWELPSLTPADVIIYHFLRGAGVPAGNASLPALDDFDLAFTAISVSQPEHAADVFTRLWWLAVQIDGHPIDVASDLLVAAGQTSRVWDAVLGVAATIEGLETAGSVNREAYSAALDAALIGVR